MTDVQTGESERAVALSDLATVELALVLSFLSSDEWIHACIRVCKKWNVVVRTPSQWKGATVEYRNMAYLLPSYVYDHASHLFVYKEVAVRSFPFKRLQSASLSLGWNAYATFAPLLEHLRSSAETLHTLHIRNGSLPLDSGTSLRKFPALTSLTVGAYAIQGWSLKHADVPNLTHVSIAEMGPPCQDDHAIICRDLLPFAGQLHSLDIGDVRRTQTIRMLLHGSVTLPHLTSLSLGGGAHASERTLVEYNTLFAPAVVVPNAMSKLRTLRLDLLFFKYQDFPNGDDKVYANIRACILQCKQLTELHLGIDKSYDFASKVFTAELATLPALQRLHISTRGIPVAVWDEFCRRCNTLEHLTLYHLFVIIPTGESFPAIVSLKRLAMLRSLHLVGWPWKRNDPTKEEVWDANTLLIPSLAHCKTLRSLHMSDVTVPPTFLSELAERNPRLQRITLPGCTLQFPEDMEINPQTNAISWNQRKRPRW